MVIKISLNSESKTNYPFDKKPDSTKKVPCKIDVDKKYSPAVSKKRDLVKESGEEEKIDGIKAVFDEIEELIGLGEVKTMIYEVQAYTEIQKFRKEESMLYEPTVLHAIFKGNPGSGKTTVARLLAKLYKEMGVLSKGHLVEVERADLVGEYIGHTAQKTKENIKKALGGVLFIDEAYSLSRGGEKDFGREAIDVLVKGMEDYKNDFVLILAGYNKEMNQFLRSNPGLNSRFPLHIDFPDYTQKELMMIADYMYKAREYCPTLPAWRELEKSVMRILSEQSNKHGNARTIRNIVEASMREQAVRLMKSQRHLDRTILYEIDETDIYNAVHKRVFRTIQKNNGEVVPIKQYQ